MIVDFERFVAAESPYWAALETMLSTCEKDAGKSLAVPEVKELHYLYQRASSDLVRLKGFPNEPRVRARLEALVARAYAEIHEVRGRSRRLKPVQWVTLTFPTTFRRRRSAFSLVVAATLAGVLFGAFAIWLDPDAKTIVLPFQHLSGNPSERVAYEEGRTDDPVGEMAPMFSARLMTHNIRVTIFAMALGVTLGVGTLILLFFNGIILGAVVCDYVLAGETAFVAGWLLPHGAVEIPAILVGGQAGLVLGKALLGSGDSTPVSLRVRAVADDVLTLVIGAALFLVWAGIIEAFFSQYHEPVLPYWIKITFGSIEILALSLYLSLAGRKDRHA
ncbi:MAG: stage II sporulation protein M [Candidatus Hydrogenedentes bacterium]|nr:stage II sporulation protein M [Candidatus Hydrogenedentota bacterium]